MIVQRCQLVRFTRKPYGFLRFAQAYGRTMQFLRIFMIFADSNLQSFHALYSNCCQFWERDVAQSIACPPLKRSVVGSILLSGPSFSLGYFPFQPVVHNWFIKGRGMYCSVYGKVHIKDPLLLIGKSSLCGSSGFPSKKCVNVTI